MGRRKTIADCARFFFVKDIHDVITHAKFGDDRLRGLGVVAGQITAFPIDFAGRPYNTLTLPCERVINIPPHLKRVATLPCEICMLKNRNAQEVIEANCHVRLAHSKNCCKIFVW